jgi:hypothetical protein
MSMRYDWIGIQKTCGFLLERYQGFDCLATKWPQFVRLDRFRQVNISSETVGKAELRDLLCLPAIGKQGLAAKDESRFGLRAFCKVGSFSLAHYMCLSAFFAYYRAQAKP